MTVVDERRIDASPVDLTTARAIEAAEAQAWADLYAAAPAEWSKSVGLGSRWIGGSLVLSWAATGRRYFSRAIGLGVLAPAAESALDEILDGFAQAGIAMFLLQSQPHCLPAAYQRWLTDRGLERFDAQDRLLRRAEPLSPPDPPADRELVVERVGPETAAEWSEFLQRVYRLDSGPWLPRLIGRPGWSQYIVREYGEIVAARGMFVGTDGAAWLGMDGPVPGVMTNDYEPDAVLCAEIVRDGLVQGVRLFVTDIEAPSDEHHAPSYENFERLGFRSPYTRSHYAPRT